MPPRKYLLTGLAFCGVCGAKLVARPRSDKQRCYVCASGVNFDGCGKIRSLAEPLEELVVEAVLLRLDSPKVVDALRRDHDESDGAKALGAELLEYERRLDQLSHDFAVEGLHSKEQFKKLKRTLDDKIDSLKREIDQGRQSRFAMRVPSGAKALREWWDDADIEQRKKLIETVVERVTVNPAVRGRNTFDPERVDVTWRA